MDQVPVIGIDLAVTAASELAVASGAAIEAGRKVASTPKGLTELKERMPFADLSKFEQSPEVTNISDLFTVEMITRYVQGKLAEPSQN